MLTSLCSRGWTRTSVIPHFVEGLHQLSYTGLVGGCWIAFYQRGLACVLFEYRALPHLSAAKPAAR